jgi:hypothetical protein
VTCQATPRVMRRNPGWRCTGDHLRVVLPARKSSPPVVCPAMLVPLLMQLTVGVPYVDQPFEGGDHLHIVI